MHLGAGGALNSQLQLDQDNQRILCSEQEGIEKYVS